MIVYTIGNSVYRYLVLVYNPEINIQAGTNYLKQIEKTWANIQDYTQRVKFILASYNAGVGHVADAARLADLEAAEKIGS